jgi:hypothetical protein
MILISLNVNYIHLVKQKTDYKQSIRTSSEYVVIFAKIGIFFFIFQAYMTFKYIYVTFGMTNMSHYTDVFNATQYSQTHLLLAIDITK